MNQAPGMPEGQVDLKAKLRASINLTTALPPSKMKKNLHGLVNLVPELQNNLYEQIDLPMEINQEGETPFLCTELNRQGDSYRSPHSNEYYPSFQGYRTSGKYRQLEELGNTLFAQYTKLYYGGQAIGSFYVLENTDGSFSCGYFAKKNSNTSEVSEDSFIGSWDSFNIIDIKTEQGKYKYTLNTTVMVEMTHQNNKCGAINLTGFLKEKKELQTKLHQDFFTHMEVVGSLIEDQQTNMRTHIENVSVGRTRKTIFTTRYQNTVEMEDHKKHLAEKLKNVHLSK